ncbi:hypothetical protein C8P66_12730 [Humitalea rosea]|uniref:Cupredoxin-like copper-binding protein n=1 Tax=Humitalea rosea TaxID=990373 RepID=A0A2W7IKC8_9PROT|nr:hypothetical protein [Humitalea rosea]PZW39827.1 hypothetical protein C8P66_12730 [Humitalea rosea]
MPRFLRPIATVLVALQALAAPALAASGTSSVKVELIDMSASAGAGPHAYDRRGRGWGMMGGGMMGGGGMTGGGMMGRGAMAIRADHATVPAGEVRFDVTNASRGMVHEMLVVAVESADAELPYDPATGKLDESRMRVLGEAEAMPANSSKTLVLTLAPGTYLLLCNVQGHYAAGMVTSLTVTP